MVTDESRKHSPQGFASEESLRAVMAGVYYRHEFARRDTDVLKAGDALMAIFPEAAAQRAKGMEFVIDGKTAFSDLLIKECGSGKGKVGTARKKALADFLREYRVLPVPHVTPGGRHPKAGVFFSYPYELEKQDSERLPAFRGLQVRKEMLLREYLKVLEFETFAVSDLGLGMPVCMPIIPIGMCGNNASPSKREPVGSDEMEPLRYRVMMIDYEQPLTTLRNHLEMQMTKARISFANAKTRPAARVKRNIPWSDLDKYLAVLDWELGGECSTKTWYDGAKVLPDFFMEDDWQRKIQESKKATPKKSRKKDDGRSQDDGHESYDNSDKWVGNKYREWRIEGIEWAKDYRIII